jgi:hypothetical protein
MCGQKSGIGTGKFVGILRHRSIAIGVFKKVKGRTSICVEEYTYNILPDLLWGHIVFAAPISVCFPTSGNK